MELPRGLRNNNPGNIRHNDDVYQGEIKGNDESFKSFSSMDYGYRAMFVVLNTYQRIYGLRTIREMISRWAPSNENHTDNYIETVSDRSKVPPDTRITTTNKDVMIPIVAAMSFVENGVDAKMADVLAGWELFIKTK